MAGELRRILNFEAIRSTPASPLTRARRVIRNHRPAAIAASSVALLFLSIGGFVSYLNSQKQALEDRSEMVRSTQAGGAAEEELATFIAEGFVVGDVLDLVDQAEVVGLSGTLEEMMDLMSRVDTRLS
ncbi:MAG: hypothetical protein MK213_02885, partial [Planctomycetes bacterium]|nr:hypothetical protein [Planctomycetota bacterium]